MGYGAATLKRTSIPYLAVTTLILILLIYFWVA